MVCFACSLLSIALLYTLLLSKGVLLSTTLHSEQWLVQRLPSPGDCILMQWRLIQEANVSLFLTLVLSVVCLVLGYRKRVLPYLFLLLLLGIGVEILGKQLFLQPMPTNLYYGLGSLHCPQGDTLSRQTKLELALGMWWQAPPTSAYALELHNEGITAPLHVDAGDLRVEGYPSGHAIRAVFLGLLLSWLLWRHVKLPLLRRILVGIALVMTMGAGALQFYIGNHLITDTVAGFLLGASLACCAIGLLQRNERRRPEQAEMTSHTTVNEYA